MATMYSAAVKATTKATMRSLPVPPASSIFFTNEEMGLPNFKITDEDILRFEKKMAEYKPEKPSPDECLGEAYIMEKMSYPVRERKGPYVPKEAPDLNAWYREEILGMGEKKEVKKPTFDASKLPLIRMDVEPDWRKMRVCDLQERGEKFIKEHPEMESEVKTAKWLVRICESVSDPAQNVAMSFRIMEFRELFQRHPDSLFLRSIVQY